MTLTPLTPILRCTWHTARCTFGYRPGAPGAPRHHVLPLRGGSATDGDNLVRCDNDVSVTGKVCDTSGYRAYHLGIGNRQGARKTIRVEWETKQPNWKSHGISFELEESQRILRFPGFPIVRKIFLKTRRAEGACQVYAAVSWKAALLFATSYSEELRTSNSISEFRSKTKKPKPMDQLSGTERTDERTNERTNAKTNKQKSERASKRSSRMD